MTAFDESVVSAVLSHMNDDHADDNLAIVRAFAEPDATAAVMTGFDSVAGKWTATVDGADRPVRVPWPNELTDRASIRREVVALYKAGAERLGIELDDH
ncbi:DUF2470 domain-containing protein [Gordonia sihwensis]|uniref:DUF2470 domain-containing protein n=1 Tax=Gordonia sihwensis TaxID=173559 RepID=UPI003D99427A